MKNFTPKKLGLLILLFTLFNLKLFSQIEPLCGTQTTQEDKEYLDSIMPQIKTYEEQFNSMRQLMASTTPTSIPVKVHIIRETGGTGGISTQDLDDAFTLMNSYYANAFMEFFICDGINYIDDSNYYNFQNDDEAVLTSANNVSGLINLYFAETVTDTSSGNSLCGYAYYPGGPDVILMDNSCAINGSTLIHEMGHFFSLRHTHGPSNSTLTTELVDGTNCDTDGDLICDTPADPQLSSANVTAACVYTGTAVDANSDAFNPDTTNFLSYSRKSCRNYFSNQQLARIYASFQVSRNYFECPSFNVDFSSDVTSTCDDTLNVIFTDNSVGATSWQWDVDGDDVIDYTSQNPSHTYNLIGNFDVNLKISDGTNTIAKTFVKYINVGAEQSIPIDENFDAIVLAGDINWTSSDNNGNGFAWAINSGQTISGSGGTTGPLTDNSGSGNYFYTEASGSNAGDVAELISNCIEVNYEDAILEFAYHMFGGTMGELHVDIDSGTGFVNDVTTAIVGQQQASQGDAFLTRQIDLSSYVNTNIRVRFRAIRGSNWQSDIAIDDVTISGTVLATQSFELNNLTIYPNPVKNSLFVKSNSNHNFTNFKISNLLGQDVMEGQLKENLIDTSLINSGIYFLTLEIENFRVVKKFVKQ